MKDPGGGTASEEREADNQSRVAPEFERSPASTLILMEAQSAEG